MTTTTLVLPDQLRDLPLIASVSGGKDSTATVLALREAGLDYRMVFADTEWEHPLTYEHLDMLRAKLGPIDVVKAAAGGMAEKIRRRSSFPSRVGRWCTIELKVEPLQAYHAAIGDDTVSVVGIRAEESAARAAYAEVEDDDRWGGWMWRPILRWTIEDVLAIHHRHGVPVNPLYLRGHDRVGCFPCIFARKEEVRLIAEHDPWRIAEIRALEEQASAERVLANAAHVPTEKKPQRFKLERASFFQGHEGRVRGAALPIDEVVAWSRTAHGGRQLPLLLEPPSGGCFRWGLCEPPTSAVASVDGSASEEEAVADLHAREARRPDDRDVP